MFYVYELIDPRTLLPFYVGKGSENRCNFHVSEIRKGRETDNPHKDRKIKQILSEDLEVIVKIVYYTDDEEDAYDREEKLQLDYGLENLTNICLGLRPPRNVATPERREKMRQAMLGNTINKGRVQTTEEKIKRGESLKRAYDSGKRVVSEKIRQTTSATHTGKTVSAETRAKISESRAGKSLIELWGEEKTATHSINQSKLARETIGKRARGLRGKSYEEIYGAEAASEIKRRQREWSKQNIGKPIMIDGVYYCSVIAASEATGLSPYLLRKRRDADQ